MSFAAGAFQPAGRRVEDDLRRDHPKGDKPNG